MMKTSIATTDTAIEWYSIIMRPSRSDWMISIPKILITESDTPNSCIGPDNIPQIAVTEEIRAIATRTNPLVDLKKSSTASLMFP